MINSDLSKREPQSYILGWLKRVFRRLNIAQKISYGYALTLSIAVVGIVGGFMIGDYYQRQAIEQRDRVQREIRLLHLLQTALLQARSSQQQFIPLVEQPELLKKEYLEFIDFAADVKQAWSALESFVNTKSYKQLPVIP